MSLIRDVQNVYLSSLKAAKNKVVDCNDVVGAPCSKRTRLEITAFLLSFVFYGFRVSEALRDHGRTHLYICDSIIHF